MKFQNIGLITSTAVLSSIITAGAYTQPAPHTPMPVGNGNDGFAFYVGGAFSSLGGSVNNQSFVKLAVNDTGIPFNRYISNSTVSTVNSLKFGGEAHLGMYFGGAEGYGIGLEGFGVARSQFNVGNSTSWITTGPGMTEEHKQGVEIHAENFGYGLRVQPTVMFSDQFGMYASVGYGSQKLDGKLINSVTSSLKPVPANAVELLLNPNGQELKMTLSGINYGLGSVFNFNDNLSIYANAEIQQFNSYSLNKAGDPISSFTATTTGTAAIPSTTLTSSVHDNGTADAPSAISIQLNTYSIGVDYAFA